MHAETTLLVRREGAVLHVTLNQPHTRNALSGAMVGALAALADSCATDLSLSCIVLRGAGGNFCAGGNFADFQQMMQSAPAESGPDPIALANREFGRMLQVWCALPQVVVAVVEGAAMGGGFGLVAVCDMAVAESGARFAMPEASLGLPPAQIVPFVAQRLGQPHTRRLALTAARIDAEEARSIGLVQQVAHGSAALEQALQDLVQSVSRCAPRALAATKAILARTHDLDATLDFAAQQFALALRNGDAAEGVRAFAEKRAPKWNEQAGRPA